MYFKPEKSAMPFVAFLASVKRDEDTRPAFPYTKAVCRCRYCLYFRRGKCTLKRCCCMSERVKTGTCTFSELLQDCFANVKDCAFHFRLRLACERFAQQRSCFLGKGHRTRFLEGCALTRRKDPAFLAQLFLLAVSEQLWGKTKRVLTAGVVDYSGMDLNGFTGNDYLYFCAASDMRFGGSHIDLCDLSNDETVDFAAFRMICHAVALFLYRQDAVKIAERAQGRRKRHRRSAGRVRRRA